MSSQEHAMSTRLIARVPAAAVAAWLGMSAAPALAQMAPPALIGKVTSDREGAMEGVLVSAKKPGGTITVTVASDAKGDYAFPADRLEGGRYEPHDQGRWLRVRGFGPHRARGRQGDEGRPAAQDGCGHDRPTDEFRVDGERAGARGPQKGAAQLRGLPFAAQNIRIQTYGD